MIPPRLARELRLALAPKKIGGVSGTKATATHAPTSHTVAPLESTSWEGAAPESDAPLMQRLAYALNVNQRGLVVQFDVPEEDVARLWKLPRHATPGMETEEFWTRLYDHVCTHIALSMSVREELQRKLAMERSARLANRMKIERR